MALSQRQLPRRALAQSLDTELVQLLRQNALTGLGQVHEIEEHRVVTAVENRGQICQRQDRLQLRSLVQGRYLPRAQPLQLHVQG